MRALRARWCVALCCAGAAGGLLDGVPAGAEYPGPENSFVREGFTIGLGIGPAVVLGARELEHVRGIGGGFSFRVGTAAGPDLVFLLELAAGAYLTEKMTTDSATANEHSLLALAVQHHLRPALWWKAGLGSGRFAERDAAGQRDDHRVGPGYLLALGAELFRTGQWLVDLELVTSGVGYGAASSAHLGLHLAVQYY
jgi:hypothetical protein